MRYVGCATGIWISLLYLALIFHMCEGFWDSLCCLGFRLHCNSKQNACVRLQKVLPGLLPFRHHLYIHPQWLHDSMTMMNTLSFCNFQVVGGKTSFQHRKTNFRNCSGDGEALVGTCPVFPAAVLVCHVEGSQLFFAGMRVWLACWFTQSIQLTATPFFTLRLKRHISFHAWHVLLHIALKKRLRMKSGASETLPKTSVVLQTVELPF